MMAILSDGEADKPDEVARMRQVLVDFRSGKYGGVPAKSG
jgi:hypothetical protein